MRVPIAPTASAATPERRHLEGHRAVTMGRADAIQAQSKRRDVARLGEIDRDLGQLFGIVGEQLLGGDRLLVARAARPPGRIAALAFLELHGGFLSLR
jgi:hypothetical protein